MNTERALYAAIEVVLLDHSNEIDGDLVDPNIAELAHAYEHATGWTVRSDWSNA